LEGAGLGVFWPEEVVEDIPVGASGGGVVVEPGDPDVVVLI